MNTHKNARLTYLRRLKMVQDITERGLSAAEAAVRHGVSAVTARKWLNRYLAGGAAALLDKSSRPERSPRAICLRVAATIVELTAQALPAGAHRHLHDRLESHGQPRAQTRRALTPE
jgi:transposase-like protein